MHEPTNYRIKICAPLIGAVFLAFCTAAMAGGGGASLDSKEGLERAADNFLVAFALLAKTKDVKLTPINGVEHNTELSGAVDFVEYQTYDSLWNYIIMIDWNFTNLPSSTSHSSTEKAKFRNDYIANKKQEYIKQQNKK
ncbi:MAG: hypothetical protein AB8B89_06110 [Gammaproteobacteria bacterium]